MVRLLALALVLLLQACSSSSYIPAEAYAPTCTPLPQQARKDGGILVAGYKCSVTETDSAYTENGCMLVGGFYNKGGEYVASHTRCASNHALIRYEAPTGVYLSGSSASKAPCVSSYCGPVSVKGYRRKDGTYVRPHTRSRPRR